MAAVKIREGIYWVGAVDWNIRQFHGSSLSTHRGTTYNAYLIIDEKVALVDTVWGPFAAEMLANIREVIDPARIDFVVANHVETDHSGAFGHLLAAAGAKPVYCSPKGREGLAKHYQEPWDFREVKTGDRLSLGRRTLTFMEAPMLHWPDSMFTYIPEEGILFPNDAFGQHLASAGRFDDEVELGVVMEEAAKYYANILWPFSKLVLRKLQEVAEQGLRLDLIGPSHGVIWRRHVPEILAAYRRWAEGEGARKALVVYDTMWGSTEQMAKAIREGLAGAGVEAVLRKLGAYDLNDLVKEFLLGKALILGCPAVNRTVLPPMAAFLDELAGLKPVGRVAACFGSYGWNGGAVEKMEAAVREAGLELIGESFRVKWVPTPEELAQARAWGAALAEKI